MGTLWGGLFLVVAIASFALARPPLLSDAWLWLGIGSLLAGNWVFVVLVANPLLRDRTRAMADGVEMALAILLIFASLVWCAIVLIPGGRA